MINLNVSTNLLSYLILAHLKILEVKEMFYLQFQPGVASYIF